MKHYRRAGTPRDMPTGYASHTDVHNCYSSHAVHVAMRLSARYGDFDALRARYERLMAVEVAVDVAQVTPSATVAAVQLTAVERLRGACSNRVVASQDAPIARETEDTAAERPALRGAAARLARVNAFQLAY